jgi:hypothetical protein
MIETLSVNAEHMNREQSAYDPGVMDLHFSYYRGLHAVELNVCTDSLTPE